MLTFKVAFLTTLILVIAGVPLSWWLARARLRLALVAEALLSLPLVLPPTVLGFYLLLAFSPENALGRFLDETIGVRLVFTFEGLLIASVLYSTPFMMQPLLAGMRALPLSLEETAYTLGKSRTQTLLRVVLPNIRSSIVVACVLTFAHTVGEFGVVLMVGGNIPSETRLLSVAIYDAAEAMDFETANLYSAVLLAFSFLLLLVVYSVYHYSNRRPLL